MKTSFPIPEFLEYWTADQIAECPPGISIRTTRLLWSFVDEGEKTRTGKPRGGDGSDDTIEWPEHTTEYVDQPRAFWTRLTIDQQREVRNAYLTSLIEYLPPLGVIASELAKAADDGEPDPMDDYAGFNTSCLRALEADKNQRRILRAYRVSPGDWNAIIEMRTSTRWHHFRGIELGIYVTDTDNFWSER